MKQVLLGRSGLTVTSVGYDLSPLRAVSFEKSSLRMLRAIEEGVTFFDIGLPEEELQKRIGHAMAGKRASLVLAGSFPATRPEVFTKDLKMVLRALKTDYLDLCQIHDPSYLPRTRDQEGFYDALLEAKKAGYIRAIGITTGTPQIAMNALEFGWYDTLQYPWTKENLSEEDSLDRDFLVFSHQANVGTISVTLDYRSEDPEEQKKQRESEILFQDRFDEHTLLLPLIN